MPSSKIVKIQRSIHIHPQPAHVNERELRVGDQVAVQLQIEGVTIWHHGIIISGKTVGLHRVIDFGSVGSQEKKFEMKTLADFRCSLSNKFVRINYGSGESFAFAKVTKNAQYFFKHPEEFGPYHLITNNCEHFATFVKTGVKASEQVLAILRGNLVELYRMFSQYVQHKLEGNHSEANHVNNYSSTLTQSNTITRPNYMSSPMQMRSATAMSSPMQMRSATAMSSPIQMRSATATMMPVMAPMNHVTAPIMPVMAPMMPVTAPMMPAAAPATSNYMSYPAGLPITINNNGVIRPESASYVQWRVL